ncbi:hypothetical protein LCGC14_1324140 [marine sediment metagenome]|uniref:Uncharacterized protein n=1 Tax=marine sediment metagenome TaxID=412755 RepID=A0A0F9L464_9ZZZZ
MVTSEQVIAAYDSPYLDQMQCWRCGRIIEGEIAKDFKNAPAINIEEVFREDMDPLPLSRSPIPPRTLDVTSEWRCDCGVRFSFRDRGLTAERFVDLFGPDPPATP